jgi:hypothetical protein
MALRQRIQVYKTSSHFWSIVVGRSFNELYQYAICGDHLHSGGCFSGGGHFALFSNAGRERAAKAAAQRVYPEQYTTLSVNWIHCLALTGTFWAPLLFSWSAIQSGYSFAWPLIGLVSFCIIITSLLVATRKAVITSSTS